MLFFLYLFTIFFCFVRRRHKHTWMLCSILMLVMMFTASNYADFENYSRFYESIAGGYRLPGFEAIPLAWRYLCVFFIFIHLSYRGMQAVLVVLAMYLIHLALKRTIINENFFWGLYLIFPLPLQCVQTRFFIATAIVWFGFSYIVTSEKRGMLRFIVCLVISVVIHKGCVLYAVLLASVFIKKQPLKKSIICSLLGAISLYALVEYVPYYASLIINESMYIRYFVRSTTKTSFIYFLEIMVLWLFFTTLAVLIVNSNVSSNRSYVITIPKRFKRVQMAVGNSGYIVGLLIMGITLPLMVFDSNFCRSIVMCTTFSYYPLASYYSHSNKYHRVLLWGYILTAILGIIVYIPFDGILKQLFSIEGIFSPFR